MNITNTLVQKLWNYCNVLHDDGMSYGDYVEHFDGLGPKGWVGAALPEAVHAQPEAVHAELVEAPRTASTGSARTVGLALPYRKPFMLNRKPFTLSLSKRRARLRRAQPERLRWLARL
jgi:hypothetical protein